MKDLDWSDYEADGEMEIVFVNGDNVEITSGEYAGLTGIIGATYPDGRYEVLFADSDLEAIVPPEQLRPLRVE